MLAWIPALGDHRALGSLPIDCQRVATALTGDDSSELSRAGDGNRARVLSLGNALGRPAADRGGVSWLVNGGARHPADRAGRRRTRDIRAISVR